MLEVGNFYTVKNIIHKIKEDKLNYAIYTGKRNKCRCGCNGIYTENSRIALNNIYKKFKNYKIRYTGKYLPEPFKKHQGYYYKNSFTKGIGNEVHLELGTDNTNVDSRDKRCYTLIIKLNKGE